MGPDGSLRSESWGWKFVVGTGVGCVGPMIRESTSTLVRRLEGTKDSRKRQTTVWFSREESRL